MCEEMIPVIAVVLYTLRTFGAMLVLAFDISIAVALTLDDRKVKPIAPRGFAYWFNVSRNPKG